VFIRTLNFAVKRWRLKRLLDDVFERLVRFLPRLCFSLSIGEMKKTFGCWSSGTKTILAVGAQPDLTFDKHFQKSMEGEAKLDVERTFDRMIDVHRRPNPKFRPSR
jgi:hypothetical protein